MAKPGEVYRTKTGKILTDANIQALADEAERGYDVDKIKTTGTRPFSELVARGYRRWYRFGLRSPVVLAKRLHNGHPWLSPVREIRYGIQRWRRGWSDRDIWSFDHYLSRVIAEGAHELREIAHGHPGEITFLEWRQILQEIEDGMRASQKIMDEYLADDTHEYEQFNRAMDHLKHWWFGLWD